MANRITTKDGESAGDIIAPDAGVAAPVRGVNAQADRRTILIAAAGAWIIRLLAITWRIRVINGEALTGLRARRQPFIFALWHGQLLPLIWHHRGHKVGILISQHNDGEIIARIAHARRATRPASPGAPRAPLSG